MTARTRSLRKAVAIGLFLVCWEFLPTLMQANAIFFPPLPRIVVSFLELLANGVLLQEAGTTILRALVAGVIGLFAGVAVALAMDTWGWARWFFRPLISLLYPSPKMALVPIFLLWFGIGDLSKIRLAAFEAFFPIVVSTYAATQAVNPRLRWSAASLGAGRYRLLLKVILPATAPGILSGLQIATPLVLIVIVVAEMISSGGGLGNLLTIASRNFRMDVQLSVLFTLMIIGAISNSLLGFLHNRLPRGA